MTVDTDDPLNLNDSDLSPSQTTSISAPSTVLTDSTADRVRIATARQVRAVFDRVVLAHDSSIETIVELDRGFRDILESLPESWTLAVDETEPPMVKFQRHFVLEGLHNRVCLTIQASPDPEMISDVSSSRRSSVSTDLYYRKRREIPSTSFQRFVPALVPLRSCRSTLTLYISHFPYQDACLKSARAVVVSTHK